MSGMVRMYVNILNTHDWLVQSKHLSIMDSRQLTNIRTSYHTQTFVLCGNQTRKLLRNRWVFGPLHQMCRQYINIAIIIITSPYPTKSDWHKMFSSSILFYHSLSPWSFLLFSCHPSHSPSIFLNSTSTRVLIYIHTHHSFRSVPFILRITFF
jgi:hypothetical protein